MDISKAIRRGLAEVNESRTWLAYAISVSPQYIGQLCDGQKKPSWKRIQEIAKAFGVKVSVFVSWGEA